MTKKAFFNLAKKRGIKIIHNDISKAKPLKEVCNNIRARYPISLRELIGR